MHKLYNSTVLQKGETVINDLLLPITQYLNYEKIENGMSSNTKTSWCPVCLEMLRSSTFWQQKFKIYHGMVNTVHYWLASGMVYNVMQITFQDDNMEMIYIKMNNQYGFAEKHVKE